MFSGYALGSEVARISQAVPVALRIGKSVLRAREQGPDVPLVAGTVDRKVRLFPGAESHTMWPLWLRCAASPARVFPGFQVYGDNFMKRFTILGLIGVG